MVELAANVHESDLHEYHSHSCAVALAFYIMSHIMKGPLSLMEISRISGISALHLRRTYEAIYSDREHLIPEELPVYFVRHQGDLARFFNLLPAPTQSNAYTETEEEARICASASEDVEMPDADTAMGYSIDCDESRIRPEDICENFCIELGYDEHILELSQDIAPKIHGTYLQDSDSQPRRTAAVSILVASHLAGSHTSITFQTSLKYITSVIGVREDTLREDYASVYASRARFVDEDMLEVVGVINIKRALEVISPVSWPPL